jgi:hypothetical protein
VVVFNCPIQKRFKIRMMRGQLITGLESRRDARTESSHGLPHAAALSPVKNHLTSRFMCSIIFARFSLVNENYFLREVKGRLLNARNS